MLQTPEKQRSLWAIPDIHGRMDLFHALLVQLRDKGISPKRDKFIFMGDYIDRGPDSDEVLMTIRELQGEFFHNVTVLLGNHERLMLNAVRETDGILLPGHDTDLWMMNGGHHTMAAYKGHVPREVLGWLYDLPTFHKEPGFFFSHAPVPRENRRSIKRQGQPYNEDELTWTSGEDEFGMAVVHDAGVIGVCGHQHALRKGIFHPRFYPHYIYADAGCGCHPKAPLVAIEVSTREVVYAWPQGVNPNAMRKMQSIPRAWSGDDEGV